MASVTTAAPAVGEDKELLISGSEAVAEALALADLDVVTAYPIRPYDTVMQAIAKKIANGQLVAEYIVAEGEHSQFEIVKHASTVGARVFCGSSGVGWMYAMECLVVTPPLRVPMVALVGNRALDDPGAFGVEHNDALVVRDLGWLLCWIDTSQEALDTTLIAYRVAEDRRVFLPLAISADGAFLAVTESDGAISLWSVWTGQKIDQRVGHRLVQRLSVAVERVEALLVLRERTVAACHPAPGGLGLDVDQHGERALRELSACALGDHGAAAERDDDGLPAAQDVLCDLLLDLPEAALPARREELGDLRAGARLDLAVEVDEAPLQPLRDGCAEPALARAHEPGQGEVPAERVQARGRHRSPIRPTYAS